jgi:hypothetical protein
LLIPVRDISTPFYIANAAEIVKGPGPVIVRATDNSPVAKVVAVLEVPVLLSNTALAPSIFKSTNFAILALAVSYALTFIVVARSNPV